MSGFVYPCVIYPLPLAARQVQFYITPQTAVERKDMNNIKLCDTKVIVSSRVVDFPDGPVRICESEIHEVYAPKSASPTRLVIFDAVDRTLTFISKAREEFSELNSVMRQLVAR